MERKKPLIIAFIIAALFGAGFYASYLKMVKYEKSPTALWKQYYQLLDKKEYITAEQAVKLILAKEPNSIKATHALMYLYLDQGKVSEATAFLEEKHKQFPDDDIITFELAKIYLVVDRLTPAIDLLNQVARSKDEKLKDKAEMLLANEVKNKLLTLKKRTDQTPVASPSIDDSEQSLIHIYQKNQYTNYSIAKDALLKLSSRFPNNANYCEQLASLEKMHGHPNQAYRALLICYKISPKNSFAIEIANYLIEKKQFKSAFEFLDEAKKQAKINPEELTEYQAFLQGMIQKDVEALALESKNAGTQSSQDKISTTQTSADNQISERDQLLNKYYSLKKSNPAKAQNLLNTLIVKYNNDHNLLLEKAYYSLSVKNNYTAVYYFVKAYQKSPSPKLAEQIGHVYANLKMPKKANHYFKKALKAFPNNVSLLKSIGYNSLNMKEEKTATVYFKRAYHLSHDPALALQLGYSHLNLNQQRNAFSWFEKASNTKNTKVQYEAESALKNIAGAQFQFLPYPFFLSLYTTPFYMSRFDMFVYPIVARLGVTINKPHEAEIYLVYRRTSDSRSGVVSNGLPQIFEDNVAVYGVGFSFKPFKNIGLKAFFEAGAGYDLIDRNRARWRSDLRGGLLYYNDWGKLPAYSKSLSFPWKAYGNFYGDLIYYSRYENLIASMNLRQGFRILQYKNTSLDVYVSVVLLQDSKREFFNNYIDIGPGIVFTPHNHYPIKLRVVWLNGYYFPIDSISPNPYSSTYNNLIAYLEANFRF